DADVRTDAAGLRLLPRARAAALAAACVLVAAADLCVRGHAHPPDRRRVPGRSDADGARAQRRPAGGVLCGISCPFAQRQTAGIADRGWRISHFPVESPALP